MDYRITLMGTGTSIGIPVPGCKCSTCRSIDKRNRRSRCSAFIEAAGEKILIDTSPELRLQALSAGIDRLDAVFWTHGHADHLHGLDDLRALSRDKPIPGYASQETCDEIKTRFDYLWKNTQRGGGKARINLRAVAPGEPVQVGPLQIMPIPLKHGNLQVFGWRCGPIAYITDTSEIPQTSYPLLENLKILVIGALRFKNHSTHFTVEQALEEIKKIRPERAYLTHISHEVSHRQLMKGTPRWVYPARDGLTLKTRE